MGKNYTRNARLFGLIRSCWPINASSQCNSPEVLPTRSVFHANNSEWAASFPSVERIQPCGDKCLCAKSSSLSGDATALAVTKSAPTGLRFSIRSFTTSMRSSPTDRTTSLRKCARFLLLSTRIKYESGRAIFNGIAGNPAPDPISITSRRGILITTGTIVNACLKCLVATTDKSRRETRLTLLDHRVKRYRYISNLGQTSSKERDCTLFLFNRSKSSRISDGSLITISKYVPRGTLNLSTCPTKLSDSHRAYSSVPRGTLFADTKLGEDGIKHFLFYRLSQHLT